MFSAHPYVKCQINKIKVTVTVHCTLFLDTLLCGTHITKLELNLWVSANAAVARIIGNPGWNKRDASFCKFWKSWRCCTWQKKTQQSGYRIYLMCSKVFSSNLFTSTIHTTGIMREIWQNKCIYIITICTLAGLSFASFSWLKTSGSATLVPSLEAAGCITSLGHDFDEATVMLLLDWWSSESAVLASTIQIITRYVLYYMLHASINMYKFKQMRKCIFTYSFIASLGDFISNKIPSSLLFAKLCMSRCNYLKSLKCVYDKACQLIIIIMKLLLCTY